MGIEGLTTYVNNIPNLWKDVVLQDTKLVIDGSSLFYHLYESNGFDCQRGGQYGEFYNAVVSFFNALTCKSVECSVIFDGADDPSDKKLDTLKKRANQNINIANDLAKSPDDRQFLLPLLCKDVFLQVLRDRGIQFAVCDSEADTEIASLAQAWNCPVLSSDSDFFIFDIKAGYIPLRSLGWNSSRLTARIFYRRKLASHFQIREELTPLLASLAGNDYVSQDVLMHFNRTLPPIQAANHLSRRGARFKSIANMLSKLPSSYTQEAALKCALQLIPSQENRCELRQVVEFSLQEYNTKESSLLDYFRTGVVCSSLRTRGGHGIEPWVLRRFRSGQFSTKAITSLTTGKCVLRVQVEDCGKVSANRSSLWLRQFVYGILNDAPENAEGKAIQEWDREGMTVKQSNVAPYSEAEVPRVSLIPDLELKERLSLLLSALDADTPEIRSLTELKLFAASLRYLLSRGNAQPAVKMNHLLALLCCCVNLQDNLKEEEWKTVSQRKRSFQPFNLQAAHSFCQWQCVLRDAIHLNFTLQQPELTPCIHKMYNGQMAHKLAEKLNQGSTPEQLILSSELFQLFDKLKIAVTNGLQDKIEPERRPQERDSGRRAKGSNVKPTKKIPAYKTTENRFAPLCNEQDSDEDEDEDEDK